MRNIRDCSVAVIGGCGFLGSHLVDHLIEDRGCRVLVIDNLVAGRKEFVHKDAQFLYGDIVHSEEFLRRVFSGRRDPPNSPIRYVFNYAAYPYVPDSFARPKLVFETNATGAINVINAAQDAGVEAVLQVSSAEIYGGNDISKDIPIESRSRELGENSWYINENHRVCPHSTYGAAKVAVDYYCQAAWRERKTPVIALRQFNCLGERDVLHPYIAPEIMIQLSSQLLNTVGMVRLGNNSFRDFMYAGDAVRAAVGLLEKGDLGQVYNLGSETGIKMYDLAKLIGRLMGFTDVKVEVDESRKRPWEIWHLQSDNTKIRAILGESFVITPLEEAVRRTVEYMQQVDWRFQW